jgi:hypothetical protein
MIPTPPGLGLLYEAALKANGIKYEGYIYPKLFTVSTTTQRRVMTKLRPSSLGNALFDHFNKTLKA